MAYFDSRAWRHRFTAKPQFAPELSWVAVSGGAVIGLFLSEDLGENSNEGWLEILGVVPDRRGRQLGAALACHVLQLYKSCGCSGAGRDVDLENSTNAMRFYEKLGFVKERGTVYFLKSTSPG